MSIVAAAMLVGSVGGCSGDSSTASVQGHVSYQGKPVTTGTIVFYPSHGRASVGSIREDGSYEIEGAPVGTHAVTIEAFEVTGGQPVPKSLEEELHGARGKGRTSPPKTTWQVPEKYASKSKTTLSAGVEPGKVNEINFEL
jgi:hypothetical protein